MSTPSVIALPISEARRCLQEAGVAVVSTVQTAPPGGGPPSGGPAGPLRVVGQRATEAGLELVVAASVTLSGEENNDD